jgi:hypothetical protein
MRPRLLPAGNNFTITRAIYYDFFSVKSFSSSCLIITHLLLGYRTFLDYKQFSIDLVLSPQLTLWVATLSLDYGHEC